MTLAYVSAVLLVVGAAAVSGGVVSIWFCARCHVGCPWRSNLAAPAPTGKPADAPEKE